jgi:hypothetical protein
MKHTKHIHFLLALVLLASIAFAQTQDAPTSSSVSANQAISTARNQYTRTGDNSQNAIDDQTLAQFPQRRMGAPFPAQRAYRRGMYQNQWRDHSSAGHALIGAAIGFGIGAAIGASHSAHEGTPAGSGVLVGGAIFAFIGGAIGSATGGPGFFAHRRRIDSLSGNERDEEDMESDLRLHSYPGPERPDQAASAKPVAPVELCDRLCELRAF